MPKEKERTIDVAIDDDKPDEKIKIIVRKPSNRVQTEAARIGALVWTKCIKDGVMTKQELDKFMTDKGIWGKSKEQEKDDLSKEINVLEKKLYLGGESPTKKGARRKKVKLSEAKDLAIEMRRKRGKLRDLLAEKITLETNTAESLSENAKFDYIVAKCTFKADGITPVYSSAEDYGQRAEDAIAFNAAGTLAEMMYSINKDFEAKLPENRFLSRFGMINEEMHLVNKDGVTVDTKGNRINDDGHYLNEKGKRVDLKGNALDEDGNYEYAVEFEDDLGLEEESKPKLETVTEEDNTES